MNHFIKNYVATLSSMLPTKNFYLATAESCTGGFVAESLTAKAGSSAWFERGFVTYTNQAKQELLGVSAHTLNQHGAVSLVCAREMAEGALHNSAAQVALATTGIAGPDGGSRFKPNGLVCFAWAALDRPTQARQFIFAGNRDEVREQAVAFVLQHLITFLKN